MRMTDDIPGEFRDEERWLKIFPRSVFVAILVCAACTVFVTKLCAAIIGHFVVPMVLSIILSVVLVGSMMIRRPATDVMRGGGQTIMELLLRKAYRRLRAVIYVKGMGDS